MEISADTGTKIATWDAAASTDVYKRQVLGMAAAIGANAAGIR